jgi:hypothetical protein
MSGEQGDDRSAGRVLSVDPSRTRAAIRGGEAVFGAGLVCPEVLLALQDLGLHLEDFTQVNFVTRSAPMGPVPAEVVEATFYNFHPRAIAEVIPDAWGIASPAAILQAQADAFSAPLAAALSVLNSSDLTELADLTRRAAERAAQQRAGRPLLAGLASLPWPIGDHMILWHASKLLREHRGDGHVACLIAEGLSGIEALIVHEAYESRLPSGILQSMRRWGDVAWFDATAELRRRSWLSDDAQPSLSEEGRRRRQALEDRTDELAAPVFESIGSAGMERMTVLGREVVKAMNAAGLGLGTRVREFAPQKPQS